jgi:pyridoxine/pyridoxamine 5'-phosphate oxidase
MRETAEDREWLDALLARSMERAGGFLRASFEMPQKSLSAAQVTTHLQGRRMVALATVTARGEPRVAPIIAHFYRGRFCIPTVATSARAKHILQRPAVSLTYFEGTALAILVHGAASLIAPAHPDFTTLEELQVASGGSSATTWGEGIYLRIEPDVMYTYAENTAAYPS